MKKHSKKYYQIFFSYIFAFLIPLSIGSLFFLNNLDMVRKQSVQLNEAMLSIIQADNDKLLSQVKQFSMGLLGNSTVQELTAEGKRGATPQLQYLQYMLYEEINSVLNLSDRVRDTFVYNRSTGRIIGMNGILTTDLYYEMYLNGESFSKEKFLQLLSEPHYMDFFAVDGAVGGDRVLMISNELAFTQKNSECTVGIVLDASGIEETLREAKWEDSIAISVFDAQGTLLFSTREADSSGENYEEYMQGIYENEPTDAGKSTVLVRQSDELGWTYVTEIPQSIYDKNGRSIQIYFLAMLLASVAIGFLFASYMTRKNYNPIRGLMEFLKKSRQKPSVEVNDEYKWLRAEVENLMAEHEDAQTTIEDNRKHLKRYHILRLMEYPYSNLENIQDQLKQSGISLPMPYNIVILFVFYSREQEVSIRELNEKERRYYELVIENIFEELISEHFQAYMASAGDSMAAVVNLPDAGDAGVEIVREAIERLQSALKQYFQFGVVALLGKAHEGLSGIHLSYGEALELGAYTSLFDTPILSYEDVADVQFQYDYPSETEQKIINLLRSGNEKEAVQVVCSLLDHIFEQKLAAPVFRCLLFDLLGTLLKAADMVGDREFADEIQTLEWPSVKMPLEKLREYFSILITRIAGHVKVQQAKEGDYQVSLDIQSYVQQNYSNPDLNVAITAQHFGLSATYLSFLYKKQTEENLLEYITNIRLQKVNALLKEDHSVAEIAKMVGMRDSGSLIRIFKRKTGLTPGQMKARFQKEKAGAEEAGGQG